jgi:hypothetical protein
MSNLTSKAIEAEAAKHGFSVDYADMRSGLFFLKRGTEVRSLGRFGRIALCEVSGIVQMTARQGNRIDQIKGSRYFCAEAAA